MTSATIEGEGYAKPRRQVWATMCGLVRDPAAAHAKLDAFTAWRREGLLDGVVVCWWKRESEHFPGLVARVLGEGFTLIELTEPRVKYTGHFVHQSVTLWYALHATPDGAYVLRARPDLMPVDDDVRNTLANKAAPPSPLPGWPDLFSERMVVASTFPTSPWYINDILLAGGREDLQRLAAFDVSPEYVYNWAEAEHFFHSHATRHQFPLLDAYLQIHAPFWHGQSERAPDLLAAQLASDCYLDVLATNLLVLDSYYQVGWRQPSPIARPEFANATLAQILGQPVPLPGCTYMHGPGVTAFYGHEPVRALVDGQFQMDQTGKRFLAALERCRSYAHVCSYGANPIRPHPEIERLARALQPVRFTDHKLAQASGKDPLRVEIRGSPERVDMTNTSESARRMEQEIAEMRRRIQSLEGTQSVAKPG